MTHLILGTVACVLALFILLVLVHERGYKLGYFAGYEKGEILGRQKGEILGRQKEGNYIDDSLSLSKQGD